MSNSIWNQDEKGEWKLYFNTESDIYYSRKKKEKAKEKNDVNIINKNFVLGTLVMTPKGIGRIIKNQEGIAHIRFKQDLKEYQISINDVSNNFNCYITFIKEEIIGIIRSQLNTDSKVSDTIEELSKIKKINSDGDNYNLIYNNNFLKKENTFEQINIMNNSKILILEIAKKTESKICRFKTVNNGFLRISRDGICFSASENIKLLGIGLYRPIRDRKINGFVQIIEGSSIHNKKILNQNVEITPAPNELNTILKIKFSEDIICKKNMDYCIIFYPETDERIYFGNGGKEIVEGDKGVNFTFKKVSDVNLFSNVINGNFPEIYYIK